jgi:hypothetical protein
MRQQLAEF